MNLSGTGRLSKKIFFVFIWGFLFVSVFSRFAEAEQKEIEVILDCSRSMLDEVEGGRKIDVAKATLISVLSQIPNDTAIGLRAFSSAPVTGNINESCQDSILIVP